MRHLHLIRKVKQTALLLFIGTVFFACQYDVLYDQYQIIENTVWGKDKEYYFTFMVKDITVPYDLTLEIRNNNQYPYQNLWLFSSEERPVGTIKRDTIECMLADEFGKWYGKGISLFQLSIPLKTNYYFTHEGQYTFSFRQGMRNDQLKGIQELGFRVSKSVNAPAATNLNEGK
ncbi:gliding motility lipoprotein GldH [Massilibacteroides sp.]|uniref:gliding motility lipoprotein GldH n=1 Tax=Massilibacteroides sp. TaxID=2034766 RepID=UPI00261C5BFE|nr:gliding motility lipoprotein GldH [Massilibacteroides sp.]MDD4515203.1 gliding motility lipoprotein GldH [Massilibacteroides sp.]